MAKRKSPAELRIRIKELQTELKLIKKAQRGHNVASIINTFFRNAGPVLIAYFVYMAFDSLAGQDTNADIGIKILGNVKVSITLAWGLSGASIIYALRQRNLRKQVIERMGGRVRELEQFIDSKRSSSRLTKRGETRKEDTL